MDILFVTATRIGDAVLSTGLLQFLIERYPSARLTIAAGLAILAAEFPWAPRALDAFKSTAATCRRRLTKRGASWRRNSQNGSHER